MHETDTVPEMDEAAEADAPVSVETVNAGVNGSAAIPRHIAEAIPHVAGIDNATHIIMAALGGPRADVLAERAGGVGNLVEEIRLALVRDLGVKKTTETIIPIRSDLPAPLPAVPISQSVADDYIVCLEDGKQMRMLKRYIRQRYGLTPDQYRKRWGLPSDYPMVAPSYSERRAQLAREIGLGHRR